MGGEKRGRVATETVHTLVSENEKPGRDGSDFSCFFTTFHAYRVWGTHSTENSRVGTPTRGSSSSLNERAILWDSLARIHPPRIHHNDESKQTKSDAESRARARLSPAGACVCAPRTVRRSAHRRPPRWPRASVPSCQPYTHGTLNENYRHPVCIPTNEIF